MTQRYGPERITFKTLFLATAFATATTTTAVQAATFDLFFSADPGQNPAIVATDDPTMTWSGTVEIDALAGEFLFADELTFVDVDVSGDALEDFTITTFDFFRGTIVSVQHW